MSNSIFILNRQTETAKGAGFPFYSKKEYQYRFTEYADITDAGYLEVPNNNLPTFQLWTTQTFDTLELIPVNGLNDGSAITLPFAVLGSQAVTSGENIYYNKDAALLPFNLDCGKYYIKIYDSASPNDAFFSEVFEVGAAFSLTFGPVLTESLGLAVVSGQITTTLPIVDASYILGPPAGGGTPIAITDPYNYSIGVSLSVGQNSDLTFFATTTLGIYTDKYNIARTGAGYTITKLYI